MRFSGSTTSTDNPSATNLSLAVIAGRPNWQATEVLVGFAPSIDFDRGRLIVDAMLVYIEARHRDWFWKGPQATGRSPASSDTSSA